MIMHLFIVRILLFTLIHKTRIFGLMSTIGLLNVKPLTKMIEWNLLKGELKSNLKDSKIKIYVKILQKERKHNAYL